MKYLGTHTSNGMKGGKSPYTCISNHFTSVATRVSFDQLSVPSTTLSVSLDNIMNRDRFCILKIFKHPYALGRYIEKVYRKRRESKRREKLYS